MTSFSRENENMNETKLSVYSNSTTSEDGCYLDNIYRDMSNYLYITYIITSCIHLFFSFSAMIGNSFIIWVVLTHHRIQTNSNILLFWLSITDLAVGISVQPTMAANKIYILYYDQASCFLYSLSIGFAFTFSALSFFTVFLVTFERFVALFATFKYKVYVTKFRMNVLVLSVWILWSGVMSRYFLKIPQSPGFKIFCFGIGAVCLPFIGVMYLMIFRLARRHQRQIASTQISLQSSTHVAKEAKIAHTTAIVVGSLYISYIPLTCLFIASSADGHLRDRGYFEVVPWFEIIVLLHCTLDPVIYCFKNNDIRCCVIQTINKILGKVPMQVRANSLRTSVV